MNKNAQTINNRLSLRPPQTESLEILSKLVGELELKNEVDLRGELVSENVQAKAKRSAREWFAIKQGVGGAVQAGRPTRSRIK